MSHGVISAAGVIASLAFALPARAESRRHDGFYAAANAGVGYWGMSESGKPTDYNKGVNIPVSLWSGYTYRSVAFGGGLTWDYFILYSVALFADIYPDPKGGFHIMPSLGWGVLFPTFNFPTGPVLGVGVGYDYWVGSEVSMGVMARMTYAPLYEDNNDANYSGDAHYTVYTPTLLYTVTYH